MHKTEKKIETFVMFAVDMDDDRMPVDKSLDELAELIATCGGKAVDRLVQKREAVHPTTYFGKGKIEELRDLISLTEATGVVCDDELTNRQQSNLEKALDVKIMDRTMVILDIFATHAITAEGKVQVELAQLKYNAVHLKGVGINMSRLGAGIGTRGPGEKKLEIDRRRIKERITELNHELTELCNHREVLRRKRKKTGMSEASLVGYTNAGKSTILNALTDANVLAEDKLFATLDTTTRKVTLPGGSNLLLTDTVGFIQKLPHQLISAFRATLEELQFADILIHVVDASDPMQREQIEVVNKTLDKLKLSEKPMIVVFNKIDKINEQPSLQSGKSISISALEQTGLEALKTSLEEVLKSFRKSITVLIPYSQGQMLGLVHGHCEILQEEHQEEGTLFELYADDETCVRLAPYTVDTCR